jgi:AraC-like DNA-binding protein
VTSIATSTWMCPIEPPRDLADALACSWTAFPSGRHRLVPDACLDLLWTNSTGWLLCGPETSAWEFELPPGTVAAGVRFLPGALTERIDVDVSRLRNRRARWSSIVGNDEADRWEQFASKISPDEVRHRLIGMVAEMPVGTDVIARTITQHLCRNPFATAADIAEACGLSCRQLHRRACRAFGYGVSTLARILRFHRFVEAHAASPGTSLAELASRAGYHDQSHLGRDCRALTELTPTAFLAEWLPTFAPAHPLAVAAR